MKNMLKKTTSASSQQQQWRSFFFVSSLKKKMKISNETCCCQQHLSMLTNEFVYSSPVCFYDHVGSHRLPHTLSVLITVVISLVFFLRSCGSSHHSLRKWIKIHMDVVLVMLSRMVCVVKCDFFLPNTNNNTESLKKLNCNSIVINRQKWRVFFQ